MRHFHHEGHKGHREDLDKALDFFVTFVTSVVKRLVTAGRTFPLNGINARLSGFSELAVGDVG